MDFPEFLGKKRIEAGLTQATVASHLGFAYRSHISLLEGGLREWRLESFFRFAELLQIPASELLKEYEENQS